MGQVGRDLAVHQPQSRGTPSARPGCSNPHPSQPGMFLGMQHLLPLSGQPASLSHHPHPKNFLPFYLNLPYYSLCCLEFPCSIRVPCHWLFLQAEAETPPSFLPCTQGSARAGSAAAQAGKGWKNVTPAVACEMITLNAENPALSSSAAAITAHHHPAQQRANQTPGRSA